MCGPALAWDWFTMDVAYVLALVGGAIVLRARVAMPLTWVGFGVLSIAVGALLGVGTWQAQAMTPVGAGDAAMKALSAACS